MITEHSKWEMGACVSERDGGSERRWEASGSGGVSDISEIQFHDIIRWHLQVHVLEGQRIACEPIQTLSVTSPSIQKLIDALDNYVLAVQEFGGPGTSGAKGLKD